MGTLDNQFESTVKETLLDTAFSTDLIVRVNDNHGQSQIIAIDVTVNVAEKDFKLRKIRGQREDGDATKKFNPNRNYPKLRAIFGIDKHIVLVMDAKQYLSYETLLTEIFTVANQPAKTAIVDLSSHQEVDAAKFFAEKSSVQSMDPVRMWVKYSAGLNSVSARLSVDVALRALTDGHSKEAILQMLKNDPQYQVFLKKERGEPKAADLYAASIFSKAILEQARRNNPDGPSQQSRPGPRRSR